MENKNSIFVSPLQKNTIIDNTFMVPIPSSSGGSEIIMGSVDSAPNSKGATVTDNVLQLAPANATNTGIVTPEAQTFGGVKTFAADNIAFNSTAVLGLGVFDQFYFSTQIPTNSSGTGSIGIGRNTLYFNTSGRHNIALGFNALNNNTNGSYNIAVGGNALFGKNTNDNICVGYNANVGDLSTESVVIGNNSKCNNSNSIVIGHGFENADLSDQIDLVTNGTSRMNFDGTTWNFGGTKFPKTAGTTGQSLINTSNGIAGWGYAGSWANTRYIDITGNYDISTEDIIIFNTLAGANVNLLYQSNKIYTVMALTNGSDITVNKAGNPNVAIDAVHDGFTHTYVCTNDNIYIMGVYKQSEIP